MEQKNDLLKQENVRDKQRQTVHREEVEWKECVPQQSAECFGVTSVPQEALWSLF